MDGDDLDGLSYRQEQFLADIIESVIVDELVGTVDSVDPHKEVKILAK